MKKVSIGAFVGAATLALAACGTGTASTKDYPDDDITLVVSYAAGGPTDLAGRAIAKKMEKELGTSIVVENVEGASGSVGTAKVVKSRPDGLTIGMTTASAVSRVPVIEKVGYSSQDVKPIGTGSTNAGAFIVRDDSPYKSAKELIAAAKKNPGKITVGTAGAQTPQAVEVARMKSEYGVSFKLVPFQGDAPSISALLGKNVDAIIPGYGDVIDGYTKKGKTRALAVMAPERAKALPDAPTLAELGFDDLTFGVTDYIMIAPKKTPKAIVDKLEKAMKAAMEDPATRKAIGVSLPPKFIGSAELRKQMDTESKELTPVLKKLFG